MIPITDSIRSRRFPVVTVAIIAACVFVFVLQNTVRGFTEQWIFKPIYVVDTEHLAAMGLIGVAVAALVSMFMHGSLLHIGFNMLYLWVFGDNVEDRMGRGRYLIFYIVCGLAATLTHVAAAVIGGAFGEARLDIGVLGASGAIAGVLGAYFRLFRGAYVRTLVVMFIITWVEIPASVFLLIWFVSQLFMGMAEIGAAGGGVAYGAHVGGFAAGYLLCRLFTPPPPRRPRPRVLDIRLVD